MAAIFTLMVIQYSMRDGRLVLPPAYDDVGYMADGAIRLVAFYKDGLLPVFQQYLKSPPHSPYSTLLAVIGFMVFGIRDWAPYAANGLLILLYLAFADHLMRGVKPWQKFLALVVVLTVPLTVMAVHEFRPDHACALLTVIGGMLILERPLLTASTGRLCLIGVVFGLAMLTKTSTFPATIAIMIGTLILGTIADLLIGGGRHRSFRTTGFAISRQIGRVLMLCVGLAILVPLPHFIVAGHRIYSYIYNNEFGYRAHIWKTAGPWWYQMYYYVDPSGANSGGGQMLGRHVYLIYLLLGLSAITMLARPSRKIIVRAAAMLLFVAGTYVAVTLNPVKTVFFGLTFQTAFLFLAIAALRQMLLLQRFRTPRLPWATAVLILAVVIGLGEFRWPRRVGRYTGAQSVARRNIATGIYRTLLRADPAGNAKVDIDGIGDINPDLFKYYNARDQYSFEFYSPPDTDKLQQHLNALDNSRFLILSQSKTRITANFYPGYKVLDAMNVTIRKRPRWRQIGYFVFPPSKRGFYVFERKLLDFSGWNDATGLGAVEGPYPNMNLPIVRWGIGPATTVQFVAPAKPVALHFTFRNEHPDEVVRVLLDGRRIFSHTYHAPPSNLVSVALPLRVAPGSKHQLRVTYSQWYSDMDMKRAILYTRFAVLPH